MSPAAADVTPADGEAELREALAAAGRACCCPARPLVVAVILPAAGLPPPTGLLLRGHHYRACRDVPQAAGATVRPCWPDPETGMNER